MPPYSIELEFDIERLHYIALNVQLGVIQVSNIKALDEMLKHDDLIKVTGGQIYTSDDRFFFHKVYRCEIMILTPQDTPISPH